MLGYPGQYAYASGSDLPPKKRSSEPGKESGKGVITAFFAKRPTSDIQPVNTDSLTNSQASCSSPTDQEQFPEALGPARW